MSTGPTTIDEETIRSTSVKLLEHQVEQQISQLRIAVLQGDAQQVVMALPMLLALTICPAMLGTQEAIRQSQSKNKREEHRARRCNLIASCVKASIRSRDINGKMVVLRDSKLYIASDPPEGITDNVPGVGHPFAGYFLPYPDSNYEGLVSTICEEPPILNWIYVDKNTYEVKYGLRVDAQPHITGPFDCTRQDRRMTLQGWEGFVAVEEFPGTWALYYDLDDDGLRTKVPAGTRVLEVELSRREKKEAKPKAEEEPKTLDEMMKKHKEQTAREEKDRAAFTADMQHNAGNVSKGHQRQIGGIGAPVSDDPASNPRIASREDVLGKGVELGEGSSEISSTDESVAGWSLPEDVWDELATVATSAVGTEEGGEAEDVQPSYVKPYVEDVM